MRRLPARSLDDLNLDDHSYKPDFELTAQYKAFSSEILRISLLGIGLYGFLLAHGVSENAAIGRILTATVSSRKSIAGSLLAFGLAALFALGHGFWATKCLGYQLQIARLLNRLGLGHWTDEEK